MAKSKLTKQEFLTTAYEVVLPHYASTIKVKITDCNRVFEQKHSQLLYSSQKKASPTDLVTAMQVAVEELQTAVDNYTAAVDFYTEQETKKDKE